ncbi:MAG TPA: amino acid transporter [Streptosporangiaceae bacterium]|jgi:hypothetical protein|nr:amino acid transporter [Streptosporangiaceae bacterium]
MSRVRDSAAHPGREGRHPGPHRKADEHEPGHPWWQVVCLTGVDYFSTIGYQPAIAFLAAGVVSPLATIVLILVTLFGALPVYRRVAAESPRGEGSLAMLEHILSWWSSKVLVLVLLGFAATDFLITMTLSAADASAHLLANSYAPHFLHGHQFAVTLVLLAALAAVFLRGFSEAIGIAVVLVGVYLALNAVVMGDALVHVATGSAHVTGWWSALTHEHSSALAVIGVALVTFPKLALGLSGFETGVLVMPQVAGGTGTEGQRLARRVASTRRLLTTAAGIMAALLLTSSFVTAVLIPARQFQPGGAANGRALAYLAHLYLGNGFGTAYDISTIAILWFAGASAMAGLLNLVPRYLPRYGMAPAWALATRPLVLVFAAIASLVTWIFDAGVDAQAGAYATGVLVLITSAAYAVTLSAYRRRDRMTWAYALIMLIFAVTTVTNMVERPDGLKIAGCFIAAILIVSLVSRVSRSYELRATSVTFDETAAGFLRAAVRGGIINVIANEPDERDQHEYLAKWQEEREVNRIPGDQPTVFLEVSVADASEFESGLEVSGEDRFGFQVLTVSSTAVANGIAAICLAMRDQFGLIPHVYFDWTEGSPLVHFLRFMLWGYGEVAPVTREVLRRAEPDRSRRPHVHVG